MFNLSQDANQLYVNRSSLSAFISVIFNHDIQIC